VTVPHATNDDRLARRDVRLDRAAVHRNVAADAATFFGSLFGPQ
jgi:hypothetical protein